MLFIVIRFFSLSVRLLYNGLVGMVLLWLFNIVGSGFGLELEINVVTALIAGFFGVPGVVFLLLYVHFF